MGVWVVHGSLVFWLFGYLVVWSAQARGCRTVWPDGETGPWAAWVYGHGGVGLWDWLVLMKMLILNEKERFILGTDYIDTMRKTNLVQILKRVEVE